MLDQINELPEHGLKSSPETLRYPENKRTSRKNQNKLYFLHLINFPFLYSQKTSENLWFSDVFRGYRSGTWVNLKIRIVKLQIILK